MLVTAKAVTLLGHAVPLSAWSPVAYFWQDVCVALIFFIVDRALRRPALAWGIYALLALYAAINVPVALVLSTPLTSTMMRAARGPLADAVIHYLTAANLVALARRSIVAVALPLMFRRRAVATAGMGRGPGGGDRRDSARSRCRESTRAACTGTRSAR